MVQMYRGTGSELRGGSPLAGLGAGGRQRGLLEQLGNRLSAMKRPESLLGAREEKARSRGLDLGAGLEHERHRPRPGLPLVDHDRERLALEPSPEAHLERLGPAAALLDLEGEAAVAAEAQRVAALLAVAARLGRPHAAPLDQP